MREIGWHPDEHDTSRAQEQRVTCDTKHRARHPGENRKHWLLFVAVLGSTGIITNEMINIRLSPLRPTSDL